MTLTVAQAMSKFLEEVTVTDYQRTSIINGRKDTAIQKLTAAFPADSDLPFSRAVLMGSAAKDTIVRPIDDIDVLAVFSNVSSAWNRYRSDSRSFLYRIRRAYDGVETTQVGARGQAVRVFFERSGHVDVAPVFSQADGVYLLPKGEGSWLTTAPTVANDWFAQRNAELGYNLAPLVRLLKKWNHSHSKRLRSFHLETIAATSFGKLPVNRQNGIKSFFQWAPLHLDVNDPGNQSGSLASYLSFETRAQVNRSLQSAAEQAIKAITAEASGNHSEAKRHWRIILGQGFPAS